MGKNLASLKLKLRMAGVCVLFQSKTVLAPGGTRFIAVQANALDNDSVAA